MTEPLFSTQEIAALKLAPILSNEDLFMPPGRPLLVVGTLPDMPWDTPGIESLPIEEFKRVLMEMIGGCVFYREMPGPSRLAQAVTLGFLDDVRANYLAADDDAAAAHCIISLPFNLEMWEEEGRCLVAWVLAYFRRMDREGL